MLLKLYSMEVQGRPLAWEAVMSLDLTWNKLLYSWSPKLLSFCLNTIQDTLPTPSNLEKWKMIPLGSCPLCAQHKCTLMHILNKCPVSLKQGRYNWRHDMILRRWFRKSFRCYRNNQIYQSPRIFKQHQENCIRGLCLDLLKIRSSLNLMIGRSYGMRSTFQ